MHCSCQYQCKTVSYEQKTTLFKEFYATADHEKQGTFLLNLIQVSKVNRRRHGTYDTPEASRRQSTVYYTIPDGSGKHVQVCRKTFSEIFALSHRKVQELVERKKRGDATFKDQRGRNTKLKKFSLDLRLEVREHINSFPREENHYSRNKSSKEFLSPDLNINRMFLAYKKKFPNSIATYKYYSGVFHKDFSMLRFGRPKSDTCSTCDHLNNKIKATPPNDPQKHVICKKLELHHRKAEKARSQMKNDMAASQTIESDSNVISIDLEQVLFIPTLTHSDMFYSRQISCYNFGIHVSDSETGIMCLWDESVTGRGGNEITSALLKVFCTAQGMFLRKPKCVIWSDNCTGQNKNKILVMLLIYLVASGVFEQIDQKFLVSGHSYLTCDRDFAHIERRKRVSKNFVPDDLEKMILSARHKNPFKVVRLERDDFKNFHQVSDDFINTSKLQISQVSWIQITKENPTLVKTKKTFSDLEPWTKCNVLKKGKNLNHITQIIPPSLECKNRITAEKLKNIESMLDYIPLKHYGYYEQLIDMTKQNLRQNGNNGA